MYFGAASSGLLITKVELTWDGAEDGVTFASNIAFGTPTAALGSPAPEPGTWTMLLTRFGLVGMAMRRRRSVSARTLHRVPGTTTAEQTTTRRHRVRSA
jgi:hypothetical protein